MELFNLRLISTAQVKMNKTVRFIQNVPSVDACCVVTFMGKRNCVNLR